jgi:T5SS/PEP-CTERM-associated repeat protein
LWLLVAHTGNNIQRTMKSSSSFRAVLDRSCVFAGACLLLGLTLGAPSETSAQLVADGETNVLDGVATNIVGNLMVGTSNSFTLLVLTNGATVTNTGFGIIGNNATATSNSVIVTSLGSTWQCLNGLIVGAQGSFNDLLLNGGIITNEYCYVGNDFNSSNNSITVTGAGSYFASHQGIVVGAPGSYHQFTLSNGGKVWVGTGDSDAGRGTASHHNLITVTGAGSEWKGQGEIFIGNGGRSNQLVVADGGRMENLHFRTTGRGNSVLITDPGSLFTNFLASFQESFNQLTISNGAMMAGWATLFVGGSTSNVLAVCGSGSLCTNVQDFVLSGTFSQVWVVNGGTVADMSGYIGGNGYAPPPRPTNNTFTVNDPGSLWLNQSNLWIGLQGGFNQLVVSNGGMVVSENGYLGGVYGNSRSNTAIITGGGSSWVNHSELQVGNVDAYQQLLIANGGSVSASNLYLGFGFNSVSNSVRLDDGSLMITSPSLSSTTDVRRGTIVINSGLFETDFLNVANGVSSQIEFNGGVLRTRGTALTNGLPFVVGDGSSSASLELLNNGTHSFADGLIISSNGLLQGNGTVIGDVSLPVGAAVSPGPSIAQLAINGSLLLTNGSSTFIELDAGAQTNDNFTGLTSVTYAGTLVLTNLAGTLTNGSAFRLFSAGTYAGAFDDIAPSSPGVGLKWNQNQLPVDGTLRVLSDPTPAPFIANAAGSDNGLTITATEGVPYDPVYLLTSTNVTVPSANWDVLATNHFDASGITTFTNALISGEPGRYFRLRVE